MPAQTETSVQGAVWSRDYISALPDSSFAYVNAGARELPYKDAGGRVNLPKVRDALAQLNDLQMSDNDRSAVKDKLQGSLKASDADDDVMSFVSSIQADSGSTELPQRMMLLRSGVFNTSKYGEVPLSAADIHEMHANFKAGIGMAGDGTTGIPVDFSHKSGELAAAWIKDLDVVDKDNGQAELWSSDTEWSRAGREAIIGKEFKMLSSDFYPAAFGEWVDAESGVRAKNVIVGAALTNRPMFTGNQPVVTASDNRDGERQVTKYVIADEISNKPKETTMTIDELRVKAAADLTGTEGIYLALHASELDDDERKKFGLEAAAKTDDDKKPTVVQASEVTGNEGTVVVQAADLKAQNDKIGALEASVKPLQEAVEASQKREAEAFVDEQISLGKIVADQKDPWVSRILADATNKELLEKLPVNKLLGDKQGSSAQASDMTAKEQLTKKAQELMAEAPADKPLGIQEAMLKASTVDPDLAKRVGDENRQLAGVMGAAA